MLSKCSLKIFVGSSTCCCCAEGAKTGRIRRLEVRRAYLYSDHVIADAIIFENKYEIHGRDGIRLVALCCLECQHLLELQLADPGSFQEGSFETALWVPHAQLLVPKHSLTSQSKLC